MQRLCSLVIFLWPVFSMAELPSFGASLVVQSQSGATQSGLLDTSQRTSQQALQIDASTGLLKNNLRFRGRSQNLNRNLDEYIVVGSAGETSSLSEFFDGEENFLSLGVDYVKGPLTTSVDIGETLNESPLSQKQLVLSVNYQFFKWGSDITLSHSRGEQQQPLSFYVDPDDLSSKPIATKLSPRVTKINYNQIWNEKWKSQAYIFYGERPEDRPRHLGIGSRLAYAWNDVLAVHGGIEIINEDKGDSLKDSRGYLSLIDWDLGFAIEPQYNFLIRVSIGTSIEKETARGLVPLQTIGTDRFDLGLEYRKKIMTLSLLGKIQEANTGFKSSEISGGISWEI